MTTPIKMTQRILPFLWYNTEAEAAAKYYVSIFKKNSKILSTTCYGAEGPGREGTVMTVAFQLEGQKFVALNGGPQFPFTEAVSFAVHCKNQQEVDYYWKKLSAGGQEVQCGWLKDKFGLCWQIVPIELLEMIHGNDRAKVSRVMQAMMGMVKLNLAALKKAFAG